MTTVDIQQKFPTAEREVTVADLDNWSKDLPPHARVGVDVVGRIVATWKREVE